MKVEQVLELVKAVSESDLTEFKYEEDGVKLSLKKTCDRIVQVQAPAAPLAAPMMPPAVPGAAPAVMPPVVPGAAPGSAASAPGGVSAAEAAKYGECTGREGCQVTARRYILCGSG